MRHPRFLIFVAAVLFGGCASLGWRFGPGFSCRNAGLFAEPPFVVHRGREYFLAWTYGRAAFSFRPEYRAMNGRLGFALQASSSSGNVAGRHMEMKIEGTENLLSLRRGGAFWWEPDGSYVALRIVE